MRILYLVQLFCFKCLVKDLREMAFSFSDLVINIGPVCW